MPQCPHVTKWGQRSQHSLTVFENLKWLVTCGGLRTLFGKWSHSNVSHYKSPHALVTNRNFRKMFSDSRSFLYPFSAKFIIVYWLSTLCLYLHMALGTKLRMETQGLVQGANQPAESYPVMWGCPWEEKRLGHEGAGPWLGLEEAPGEMAGGGEGMEESSTVIFEA